MSRKWQQRIHLFHLLVGLMLIASTAAGKPELAATMSAGALHLRGLQKASKKSSGPPDKRDHNIFEAHHPKKSKASKKKKSQIGDFSKKAGLSFSPALATNKDTLRPSLTPTGIPSSTLSSQPTILKSSPRRSLPPTSTPSSHARKKGYKSSKKKTKHDKVKKELSSKRGKLEKKAMSKSRHMPFPKSKGRQHPSAEPSGAPTIVRAAVSVAPTELSSTTPRQPTAPPLASPTLSPVMNPTLAPFPLSTSIVSSNPTAATSATSRPVLTPAPTSLPAGSSAPTQAPSGVSSSIVLVPSSSPTVAPSSARILIPRSPSPTTTITSLPPTGSQTRSPTFVATNGQRTISPSVIPSAPPAVKSSTESPSLLIPATNRPSRLRTNEPSKSVTSTKSSAPSASVSTGGTPAPSSTNLLVQASPFSMTYVTGVENATAEDFDAVEQLTLQYLEGFMRDTFAAIAGGTDIDTFNGTVTGQADAPPRVGYEVSILFTPGSVPLTTAEVDNLIDVAFRTPAADTFSQMLASLPPSNPFSQTTGFFYTKGTVRTDHLQSTNSATRIAAISGLLAALIILAGFSSSNKSPNLRGNFRVLKHSEPDKFLFTVESRSVRSENETSSLFSRMSKSNRDCDTSEEGDRIDDYEDQQVQFLASLEQHQQRISNDPLFQAPFTILEDDREYDDDDDDLYGGGEADDDNEEEIQFLSPYDEYKQRSSFDPLFQSPFTMPQKNVLR